MLGQLPAEVLRPLGAGQQPVATNNNFLSLRGTKAMVKYHVYEQRVIAACVILPQSSCREGVQPNPCSLSLWLVAH